MKLVIDNSIPFMQGLFEPYGTVVYKNGEDICKQDIMDADGLIIRSRTTCNEEMLSGTAVKMIATATVGTNHIDISYCNNQGINIANATGCSSGAVSNYVFSALYGCASRKSIDLKGKTIGVIGAGRAGSKVIDMARILGFSVLVYDPVREDIEGSSEFCSLDDLLAGSDIITIHAPLTNATRGMCNREFFEKMRFGAFFINTARGEIVNEEDLMQCRNHLGPIILDVWNNEPNINLKLMELADIATPHISGYTLQAKFQSAIYVVRATARFFGISDLYDFIPQDSVQGRDSVHVDVIGMTQGEVASVFQYNFPIFTDDFMFRMAPDNFLAMRQNYRYRREFHID